MSGRRNPSLTFRLTLLFASASAVVLFLLGMLIGKSLERHFEDEDFDMLSGKMSLVRHVLDRTVGSATKSALAQQLDDALTGHHDVIVLIRASDGEIVYANRPGQSTDLQHRSISPSKARMFDWTSDQGVRMRGIASVYAIARQPVYTVIIGTETTQHDVFLSSFRYRLWSVVLIAAVVMGALGWFVAQRGLAPLQAIRRRAAEVTAKNLNARLPTESIPRELAELTDSLNDMLSRLESSFLRLSEFSSDLAHELRTPVSNLLTQTQVTLSKARSAEDYRDVLASNAEEFERLSRMIADMLFLAKADNQQIVPSREPIDLALEVRSVMDFYGILADEKRLRLSVVGEAVVIGDRLMLRRAIGNLISNAVRHTPEEGRITIRIDDDVGEEVRVSVENSGPRIPEEHLGRLFDRFYRVDSSRQRSTEGAGLGLAIVRSIMLAHGGNVRASSSDDVTRFILSIPA